MGKLQSAPDAPVVIHFDTWLDFLLLLSANYTPKSEALAKRQRTEEEAGGSPPCDPAHPASSFREKKSKRSQVSYLEKKNELREALDWLHHQAVERDAVHAGRLLPLLTKGDIASLTARKCTGVFFFVRLFVCLFIFSCREISSGGKARGLLLRIEARQNSRLRRCGRASGRERGMKTAAR